MKTQFLRSVLLVAALYITQSFDTATKWFKAGSEPTRYEMGPDPKTARNNKNLNTIKSKEEVVDGFGTYMTQIKAEEYAGKRVRMTGFMKSSNLFDWAGFWMRVDGRDCKEGKSLAFDNMFNRAVKGTTDWSIYQIVLDVPKEASTIAYGALISGSGQIWFDDIQFEIVDNSVETTGFY